MSTTRVLIVEDNLVFGNQCVKALLDHDYDVLLSNNAESAKLHILNSKINIAIIDLMLPPTYSVEGIELYRYMLSRGSNIKVLFMTSKDSGTTDIVASAMKMGATDFLDKQNELFFERLLVTVGEMVFTREHTKQSENIVYQELMELHKSMVLGFDDMKRGQAALYSKLNDLENKTIENIRLIIQQGLLEQGEIVRTLDAIRRTLKFIQSSELIFNNEFVLEAKKADGIIKSEIGLDQKLELTLPIIPLFLNYKVELGSKSNLQLQNLFNEIEKLWVSLKNQKS